MAFPFFHGILDVTFRFFDENYGREALRRYLRWLAENYYAGLLDNAAAHGLDAVETWWRELAEDETAAQPRASIDVQRVHDGLTVEVARCPAFLWMEENGRHPCDCYCEQCAVMGEAVAQAAGLRFSLRGGRGQCTQIFRAGSEGA